MNQPATPHLHRRAGLAMFGLGLAHALYSLLFFAAAFEHPPGNAALYWPGLLLALSAWALWRRTWWARPPAVLACVVVLASPLVLWGGFDQDPLGFVRIALGAAWLAAAIPSGWALYRLARSPVGLPLRERPHGFRWTLPLKGLLTVLLVAVGVGLHAARPIEAWLARWADRQDGQYARRLTAELVQAARSGDRQAVERAEAAFAEGKTFSWAPYRNPQMLPALVTALERHRGPEDAAVRWALLRALHLRGFDNTGAQRLSFVQERLLGLLEDPDPEVRRLALRGVSATGAAVEPLARRVADPDEETAIRVEALRRLSQMVRDPHRNAELRSGVLPVLTQAARDGNEEIRSAAVRALVEAEPEFAAEAVHAGTLTVDDVLPALVEEFGGRDWGRQEQAAQVLASFGARARAALPALRAALEGTDTAAGPPRRRSAARRQHQALREAIGAIEGAAEVEGVSDNPGKTRPGR